MKLELHADDGDHPLPAAIQRFASDVALPRKTRDYLDLVLDELVSNVRFHGAATTIHVDVLRADDTVVGTVRDNGLPFDPTEAPPADTESSIDERELGGLGIHFVRALTREFSYRREGVSNVVRFTLPIEQQQSDE